MLFGRLYARIADKRTCRHSLVWPELAACHTNGPRSFLVNQPHSCLNLRSALEARSVSSHEQFGECRYCTSWLEAPALVYI